MTAAAEKLLPTSMKVGKPPCIQPGLYYLLDTAEAAATRFSYRHESFEPLHGSCGGICHKPCQQCSLTLQLMQFVSYLYAYKTSFDIRILSGLAATYSCICNVLQNGHGSKLIVAACAVAYKVPSEGIDDYPY